jgi:hypothetical protein
MYVGAGNRFPSCLISSFQSNPRLLNLQAPAVAGFLGLEEESMNLR